jgi:hypothetical protein
MAERAEPHSRLDEISTRWSAVADPAAFVMRDGPAMRRYLEALLGRADDAEEVAQEFFLTVVRGGLGKVQVPRGRFRHYLKTCLRNAAAAFLKRRRQAPLSDEQAAELADDAPDPASAAERVWVDDWRRCVLDRVWRVLEQHERKAPGSLCFTVLRLAGDHPEETSEQLARRASETLNVGPGATVNLNGTTNLRTSATVNITGGTLNLGALTVADGAAVNWSGGKVNFADGAAVTAPVMNLLLGGTNTLSANRTLSATAGTLGIGSNLAVNGGTIAAADLSVDAGLSIGAFGTVTAAGSVSPGAGKAVQIENFGTLGAGSFIVNNGATLPLNGPGAAVTGFTANNAGLVQGTGRFFGGLAAFLGTGLTGRPDSRGDRTHGGGLQRAPAGTPASQVCTQWTATSEPLMPTKHGP